MGKEVRTPPAIKWAWEEYASPRGRAQIFDAETNMRVAGDVTPEAAALIVRSVNALPALMAALDDLVRAASTDRVTKAHIKAGEAALKLGRGEAL